MVLSFLSDGVSHCVICYAFYVGDASNGYEAFLILGCVTVVLLVMSKIRLHRERLRGGPIHASV